MEVNQISEEKPMKAMYEHCVNVYARMSEEAISDGSVLIWEGHTTALFRGLELSTPYYTTVMRHLKNMGCLAQIRRGGGNARSKWQLNHEPQEAAFTVVDSRTAPRTGSLEQVKQQIRDLSTRVLILEEALGLWKRE
jgi:hypothetical protein